MNKIPMTADGYNRLQEELKRLKTVDRPAIIRAIAEARDHGDLAENAEYHSARDRQSFIEGRLAEIEDKIARAEIIDVSKLSGSVIKFGARVTLADEETDEEQTFLIVGEDEADISQGRLSVTSPLARALIGKRTGEASKSLRRRAQNPMRMVPSLSADVAFGTSSGEPRDRLQVW
jgi:transcription elongation factor GreA